MTAVTVFYGVVAALFVVYAAYFLWLSLLPAETERRADFVPPSVWPSVTVQLPIYNEGQVASCVIAAACALDYPRDRMEIQVLDDSTDHTSEIIANCVALRQEQGIRITQLRRPSRQDYKAGNLAHGLAHAQGDLVAVFDADFLPEPGWLRRTAIRFVQPDQERLGAVQTRWSHQNADASALTRAQSAMLDEYAQNQAQRANGGLMPIFQGAAGLWRRACIVDAGGWSGKTLAEDLDITYRAQLRGWTFAYDSAILVSAELPTSMVAYRRQQFRWAKGPLQVARSLASELLGSSLSWRKKADALLFLTSNVVHLLLVLLLVLKLPLLLWPNSVSEALDVLMAVGIAGLCAPSVLGWARGQRSAPLELFLQCGMALVGARGVLSGLLGPPGGEFHSTPKRGITPASHPPGLDGSVLGELLLLVLALVCVALAICQAQWFALPILAVFVLGLGWVGSLTLYEMLKHVA